MFKELKSIPIKLNQVLDKRRKFILVILFFMAIVFSLVETAGVSIVMPFISVASNPGLVNSGRYKIFYDFFGFTDTNSFIITFGASIIIFYFFRSLYNMTYVYALNKFSFGTYRFFAARLFRIYLSIPYKTFVQKNPSVFSQMIIVEALNLSSLLLKLLNILSESFTVILLYFFMLLVNWQTTLILTGIQAKQFQKHLDCINLSN